MIPQAQIMHALARRTRFAVPEKRHDAAYFAELADTLSAASGVETVRVNPLGASVTVMHVDNALEDILSFAREHALFEIGSGEQTPMTTGLAVTAARLERVDERIQRHFQGQIDVNSVVFVALILMAVTQILRGQIAAPAVSLMWYAYHMLQSINSGQ